MADETNTGEVSMDGTDERHEGGGREDTGPAETGTKETRLTPDQIWERTKKAFLTAILRAHKTLGWDAAEKLYEEDKTIIDTSTDPLKILTAADRLDMPLAQLLIILKDDKTKKLGVVREVVRESLSDAASKAGEPRVVDEEEVDRLAAQISIVVLGALNPDEPGDPVIDAFIKSGIGHENLVIFLKSLDYGDAEAEQMAQRVSVKATSRLAASPGSPDSGTAATPPSATGSPEAAVTTPPSAPTGGESPPQLSEAEQATLDAIVNNLKKMHDANLKLAKASLSDTDRAETEEEGRTAREGIMNVLRSSKDVAGKILKHGLIPFPRYTKGMLIVIGVPLLTLVMIEFAMFSVFAGGKKQG